MTLRLLGLPDELRLEIEQNSPGITTEAATLIIEASVQQAQAAAEETTAEALKEIQSIIGPHGTISRLQSGGIRIGQAGIGVYLDGVLKTSIDDEGNLFVGSNIDGPATTTFSAFVVDQTYNNEAMGGGDLLIGNNSSGVSNIKFDTSAGQLQFRLGQTVTAYMDTDGTMKFLAGTIGGWVIGATSLTDAAATVGLSSAVTGGNDIRLWAGNTTPASGAFRVYEDGAVVASNATISGSITATTGTIGGWSISAFALSKLSGNIGIILGGSDSTIRVGDTGGNHIVIDGANQRIRSSTYVAGSSGMNIDALTGDAEFNNITARGELKTFLLTSSNQMAVAGNIIVSKDAGKLGADVSSGATTVNFGKALTVGNWIKIQGPDSAGTNNLEWMLVGSLVSGTTYNVTRNVDGSGANGWLKDTPFVVIGASGDSRIELVAGASGSLQLITQGAAWNTQTVQASMSTVDGAITAGAGTVLLDSNGIKIIATGLLAVNNGYKFVDTADTTKLLGGLYAIARHTPNNDAYVELRANPQDGSLATVYGSVDSVSSNSAIARLTADSGANAGAASEFNLLQDGTNGRIYFTNVSAFDAQAAFVFNETGADIDQRMEGDTDANLFMLDAGLDAIGLGGAAESGYKLKVTGSQKITDGLEWGGWSPGIGTWSYSSADSPAFVISINADVTSLIGVGDRVKLTQTTAKYFIVTAVGAFSGGATLVTVYGGTDYTLANAAISSPYYSHAKAPFGFPMSPVKWTVEVTDTTSRSQSTPVQNTWYNATNIVIPIGAWRVAYSCNAYGNGTIGTPVAVTTLSTANNTESDADFTAYVAITITGSGADKYAYAPIAREKHLVLASKTTYYQNYRTTVASQSTVGLDNASAKNIIRAICAYL